MPNQEESYFLGKTLSCFSNEMSDSEFQKIRQLIYDKAGIEIEPQKKSMIEVRLRKRLLHLRLSSFNEYIEYLFSSAGLKAELVSMVDAITTNTTHFFRELPHFDFLLEQGLPELCLSKEIGFNGRPLRLWSAGCST
ncbi:MAG TPA: hypothetical protein VJ969_10865, partial [Desulfopila sp.]|nr:hypothetical protein [Desulfopila sp.]